jgi:hypothetical protein
MYFYVFNTVCIFIEHLMKNWRITSNLSAYVVQQDLLDNPPKVSKRKAIAIAKETFTSLYGPDTQAAATGSA